MYDNFDTTSGCALCLFTMPSPGGSGKTYTIARAARFLAGQGKRVLIVQPTKGLIEKTIEKEINSCSPQVDCVVIHSDSHPGEVKPEILKRLEINDDCPGQDHGTITLITHAAFINLPCFPGRSDIFVFVDEVPNAAKCKTHNLSQTHAHLTDSMEVVEHDAIYGRVEVTNADALEKIAKNETSDDLWEQISETAWLLLSDAWEVFVNLEQYRKLQQGNGQTRQLSFHCVLRPQVFEGFKRVTIAGADVEESIFYNLFADRDVKFEIDEPLENRLRYNSHKNGNLITIYYAFPGSWSKQKQLKVLVRDDPITNVDRMVNAAKDLFGDEPFLWMGNKSVQSCPFETSQAIRLPNVPHGLNQFDHIHNVVILSASNPPPAHFKFLETRGVSPDQVRIAIQGSSVYQAVLRTSIRSDSDHHKIIVVPDQEIAEWLANQFPGCIVEKLRVGIPEEIKQKKAGRKRKYESESERQREYRKRKKEAKLKLLTGLNDLNCSIHDLNINMESRYENTNISISDSVTQHACGTLYPAKKAGSPLGYVDCPSDDDFIDLLRELHKRCLEKKEKNMLISPAIFDPNRCQGSKRAMVNIVYVRGIWLDFEGGDLNPNGFPDLFPDTRMAIFNTYNHTPEAPRFRVVLPTKDIMTPEAYIQIWEQIELKLRDAGYSVGRPKKGCNLRKSGLDKSKKPPTSLFYLPCQAKEPEDSFFWDLKDGRAALDPTQWIENSIYVAESFKITKSAFQEKDREPDQALIEAAVAEWRMTPKSEGNDAFYRLAVQLKKAGMRDWEIEATLADEARYAHSPSDRQRQISSIMKSLGKLAAAS